MVPKRIQRKRTKGWRMPPNTVYVGRPTKWGNPFIAGAPHPYDQENLFGPMTLDDAVKSYRDLAPLLPGCSIEDLRGKNLACWCPIDKPCHADVLLELANSCATPPAVLPGDRRSAARSFPGSGPPPPMGDA